MLSYPGIQPVNCKIDLSPFLHGMARLFDFAQILDCPEKKGNLYSLGK
jgi:hypothetical protein